MIARLAAALTALSLALPAWATIEIEEIVSPGGIEAWLVEGPLHPLRRGWSSGSVGGSSLDPVDKRGATFLMTGLLEEGALPTWTRSAFGAAVEGWPRGSPFDTYRDAVVVSAQMLTQNRDEAADLLARGPADPASTKRRSSAARQSPRSHRGDAPTRARSQAPPSTPWAYCNLPMARP